MTSQGELEAREAALRVQLKQRDALLEIIGGEDDGDGSGGGSLLTASCFYSEEVSGMVMWCTGGDNPGIVTPMCSQELERMPIEERIAVLGRQLADRDEALDKMGSAADNVISSPPPPPAHTAPPPQPPQQQEEQSQKSAHPTGLAGWGDDDALSLASSHCTSSSAVPSSQATPRPSWLGEVDASKTRTLQEPNNRPAVVPPLDLGETRRTVSDIKISVVTGRSSSSATSKSLERLTGGNRDFSNLALMQQPGMPARRRDSVPAAQSYYESSSAVQTGVGGGGASANGRLSVASSEEAGVPSMGWQPALTPPEAPGQRENRAEGAEEVRMESSEEEGGEGEGPRYIRVGSATAMRKAMRESKGLSSSLGRSHDMILVRHHPPAPSTVRDILFGVDDIAEPWGESSSLDQSKAAVEANTLVKAMFAVLRDEGGEEKAARMLLAHAVCREAQFKDAVELVGALDLQRRDKGIRCERAESELEQVRKELERERFQRKGLENRMNEPRPSDQYARDDHVRALEALEETQAKLAQVQSHVSRLEEMLRVRDEGLGAAVEGVEAMRADRASMRDASLAALERLSLAETQLREAVKERDDTEYRLGEEIVVLEQQLKQASTYLNIEKESHAENLKAATALREELHAVKKAAADTEKELRTRVAVQSAQIQELEEEIEDLHHSAMELEALLVEQQTTLDRLVDTTLSEVAKRERMWAEQRSSRDSKIEMLVEISESKGGEAQSAAQAVSMYEKEFERMEQMHEAEIHVLKKEQIETLQQHAEAAKARERDQMLRQRDAATKQVDYESRIAIQSKQIEELLRQKAWMTKQLGAPLLDG